MILPRIPALAPGGDAGRAIANYVGGIYSPTWTRLDGLLAGILLAALRAFRPVWWTRVLAHGWKLLGGGLVLIGAASQVDPVGHAGAVLQFPLVALGGACLLLGLLSPGTPFGQRALPGARMLAVLAFSLYLTNRQVYAWLDNVTGDLAADARDSEGAVRTGRTRGRRAARPLTASHRPAAPRGAVRQRPAPPP